MTAKRGAKSKYTPETVALIVEGILLGFTDKHAAEYAGISEDTFARYKATHTDFADQIREAHAKRRRLWLSRMLKAGEKDWRAIADLMDRCEPDYRKKTDVSVTVKREDVMEEVAQNLGISVAELMLAVESGDE